MQKPSGRFVLRMEPQLHGTLRDSARRAGISLNEFCVQKLAEPSLPTNSAAELMARAAAICGSALEAVAVFGSWARGTAALSSDVDVLIVASQELAVTRGLYATWDEGQPLEWEGRRLEPHFVHLPESDARISGLWAELALDAIVVFDREFRLSRHLVAVRHAIVNGRVVRRTTGGHAYWVAA